MIRYDQTFIDKIPDLIQQGIIRVYNRAKDIGFEIKTRVQNVAAGSATIQKPANWKETLSILMVANGGSVSYLQPRSYDFCYNYWPYYGDIAGSRGKPKYYSDLTENVNNDRLADTYNNMYWFIVPILDAVYTFEIIYRGIPLFNTDNQTNFLTIRYPDLLLYSCLIEACLFLDNQPKLAEYKNMFNEELDNINKINKDRSADRTIIRENN